MRSRTEISSENREQQTEAETESKLRQQVVVKRPAHLFLLFLAESGIRRSLSLSASKLSPNCTLRFLHPFCFKSSLCRSCHLSFKPLLLHPGGSSLIQLRSEMLEPWRAQTPLVRKCKENIPLPESAIMEDIHEGHEKYPVLVTTALHYPGAVGDSYLNPRHLQRCQHARGENPFPLNADFLQIPCC